MSTPGEAVTQPPRAAPPQPPKKGFWETAGARIGILSAILGLIVAVLGLPGKITDALRDIGVGVDPALAAEVEESRPILEVKYVLLTDDLLGWRRHRGLDDSGSDSAAPATRSEKARTLLSLPIVLTEAGDDSDLLEPTTDDILQRQTAFLLIENRGKRDATGIALHGDQLSFATSPHVQERGQDADYVAALRRGSSATTRVTVAIPQTLAPGDAVLVPVFVSGSLHGRFHEWWVMSRTALLPDSLTFTDAVIQRARSAAVRRMVNPTLVERGILDRG